MIELPCLGYKKEDTVDYEYLGIAAPEGSVEETVMNVCFTNIDWFHPHDDEKNDTLISCNGDTFVCTLSYNQLKKLLCSQ